MIAGEYRDHFPRVWLTLPGSTGPVDVEFIVDTGFEGELIDIDRSRAESLLQSCRS